MDKAISTVTIALPTLNEPQYSRLEQWLQSVLWELKLPKSKEPEGTKKDDKFNVHRLKGRIGLGDNSIKMIQGVREVYEIIDVAEEKQESSATEGKIVIIGKHVSGLPWQESLEHFLEERPEAP